MAKIFTFADRAIPVQFFDTDPINVTLIASDEMDRKILEADKLIQADTHGDLDARKSNYRAAVDLILRSDITEQILSRSDYADSYALINLYQAVVTAYGEGKRKTWRPPAEGASLWDPPDAVLVSGEIYPIRTDYRAGIAYSMAAMDGTLTPQVVLDIWYPGPKPDDFAAAQNAANAFYRRSEETLSGDKSGSSCVPYSFLADDGAILAAFQRAYGIDLSMASMHWWRFMALLEGLVTHTFEDRVRYRVTDPGKIKDKATREHHQKMRRIYQLDENGRPANQQAPMTLEDYNQWMLQRALTRKEE